jgi:hypothetical protein
MSTHTSARSKEAATPAFVPGRGLLLQRKCACGSPTSSLAGDCTECKSRKRLQAKLAIGASKDPVDLAGSGVPLDAAPRQEMEQRFGHDFSKVRVHSGQPNESPNLERGFELDPQQFLKPMNAPAIREREKCEEFPGGSTDCEVDEKTGTPTGKVTRHIDETNRCTRPCVEQHEAVHVKQFKTFCPQLRDCYRAADKGKRPVEDCVKMAIFGTKERECEAYKVSVPCVENRLKNAKECQSKENKDYGIRKLASEKCFRNNNCGGSGAP